MVQDPYKVLGIQEGASQDEIKRAYRRKAKEYHPDLHSNDAVAQKKMGQVNEAYDMLMNPEKYAQRRQQQGYQQYQQSSYGGQQAYGQQGYGNQGGESWGGFYGFDFEDFFGGAENASGSTVQQESTDTYEMRHAVDAINSRQYAVAINQLSQVLSSRRNARWYYLSAVANHGAGNTMLALEHIQKAVQMEPNNPVYHRTLQQYRRAGQTYQQQGRGYGMDAMAMQRFCCHLCALNFFCRFCFCC